MMPLPDSPLFSVIIPTRNRSVLLSRAVAGVRAQRGSAFEIVVVDDGSAAEHAKAHQALAGPDLKLVRLEPSNPRGNGPAVARNIGVTQSCGLYVAFCDDDDEWISVDHLATAGEYLAADPAVDYMFANQEAVTGNSVTNPDWLPELAPLGGGDWRRIDRGDVFSLGHFPHLNTTIVARALFERIGGMWETPPYSSDLDFFLRATDAAKAIAFRHRVVARHYVPERGQAANVSTALADTEKHLVYTMIASHLFMTGTSPEAIANARKRASWAYKHLAEAAVGERRHAAARAFASMAMAAQPSWKWLLYCCWLALRRH
jgi:glycosyltransferase involved in cell wall biosynthesis